jgi:predicted ATP-grasp superfamily ATP-dependent carboligase
MTRSYTQVPCIVLGLETQIGLGLVRELGRAGVKVIGVTHLATDMGLCSKYLSESHVVPHRRNAALLQRLQEIARSHGGATLLTVSEANLKWLASCRDELGAALEPLHLVVPQSTQLASVLDKEKTLALAQEVGVPVPQTCLPGSASDPALNHLRFPVVLKWADPEKVSSLLQEAGLPLHKAEFAMDLQALQLALQRYDGVGHWPLVQEYAPGLGLGQFFYIHNGQALRVFQHRRVAEWPPEGGYSSVCDAVPLTEHTELQALSLKLLRAMQWEGVAMVEYRHDPATNRSVLMEINGRFWGSFPLAVHCKAGFALLSHAVGGVGQVPALPAPRDDLRCRMVLTEVKRLLRITLKPHQIKDPMFKVRPLYEWLRFTADFLKPNVRYFLWSLDDPKPWLADAWGMVKKAVRR